MGLYLDAGPQCLAHRSPARFGLPDRDSRMNVKDGVKGDHWGEVRGNQ
jgi:hypothetical protein